MPEPVTQADTIKALHSFLEVPRCPKNPSRRSRPSIASRPRSGGLRYHYLVVLHARSYAWVFTLEEAEAEAARLADYGESLIVPITPDMVTREAVVVQIIHTYYAN